MPKWLQAFRQTTTYLGVVVVAIIWGGIYLLASAQHERAYQDALRQGSNLTRVLEEYVRRVVQQCDQSLLALRRAYQRNPDHFDIDAWIERTHPNNDLTFQYGIADANGFLKYSTRGPIMTPTFVGGREHFTVHINDPQDQLYISPPLVGHVTGRLTIQMTRRLMKPDGSFDGVVASALDVLQLERFFSSLDLGKSGIVSLMGLDGIIRARGGQDPSTRNFAGLSVPQSPVFAALRQNQAGSYWNTSDIGYHFGGASRLMSYRAVSGVPLVAMVGLAEQDIFQEANATLRKYIIAGLALTLIVLIVMALGAAREAHILAATGELQKSKQSLETTNHLLNTALANMANGLCMFDREQRLIVCNERYGEMYSLDPEQTRPGTTFRSILEARTRDGIVTQQARKYIDAKLKEIVDGKPCSSENELSSGKVYAVSHQPMPDGSWVATHLDITEQRHAKLELDETRLFLDSIIENIPAAVVVKDAKTRKYLLINRAFETMLGMARSDVLGRTVFDLHRGADATAIDDADSASLQDRDRVQYNEIEVNMVGGLRTQATNRMVLKGGDGAPKYLIALIEDVTERKKAEQRVAFLAHHDALTGLANRAALTQKIDEAAARQRRRGEPFSVLLLDLDRFKQVNDTLGHPAGDILLTKVAARLKTLLRETDVLARLGGDEFAIVQAGETDQREAAKGLADRVIGVLGKPFDIEGGDISIGTSIGIALAPEHDTGSGSLLKMADLALYRAKSAGRNGYRFFDAEMSEVANARQEIESDLRRAILQNELELHYQPIIDAKTLKISGAEALVRWRHPTKGVIAPDLFIPLAEETGLITQIGDWVLRAACTEAATWPAGVKVAVNLSVVQFHKTNLPEVVMRVLADTGLSPDRLELEITETALIESAAECLPALRKFKDLGITIALDDFGTGYSSLSQLAMFPFDKIKIDKSFTQNLTKRSECAAIISATLTLAKSLDIATTAEGVETVDQYRLLRLAGVNSLQGYLFKRPGPAAEIDFACEYGNSSIENAA
jgi:diguanylate cyclase (GGDEF)-like protein/PAS domain S-box-containing protein